MAIEPERYHELESRALSPPRSLGVVALEAEPLGLHGPFFNPETGVEAVYPRYDFDVDPSHLEDTATVMRTRKDHLRYVLRILEETCGDDFPQFADITEPKVRDSQIKNRDNYLNAKIERNGEKMKRESLFDARRIFRELHDELLLEQHPAAQLMQQIAEKIPKTEQIDELRDDLLTVLFWPRIKPQLFAAFRNATKS